MLLLIKKKRTKVKFPLSQARQQPHVIEGMIYTHCRRFSHMLGAESILNSERIMCFPIIFNAIGKLGNAGH